jgi:hypothetical protein
MRNSSSGLGRGANLLLAAGVVLLTLAGIELALFLFYPTDYLEVAGKDSDYLFNEVLHQPSTVPGLSFELSPNRQKKLEGIWIRTNTFGMRDAAPEPFQDESPTRVVVLGDSFTFGYRVDGELSYPSVLEERLNDGAPNRRSEVLNLGVSGYNTQDEGFAVIDLLGRFSEYPARTMRVRRGDPHPSPLGHEIAAEAICEWILDELRNSDAAIPSSSSST